MLSLSPYRDLSWGRPRDPDSLPSERLWIMTRARQLKHTWLRKPFGVLAVTLAVIAAKTGEKWRGWMGIEPTQDASTAPRKRF